MRFNMRRPCPGCPWRLDEAGYLTPERAAEIVNGLLSDDWTWFGCHQTTEYVEDPETGEGDQECVGTTEQCAGWLLFSLHYGRPNVPTRIALATGILQLEELDMQAPVARTPRQFIRHHARAWRISKDLARVRKRVKRR